MTAQLTVLLTLLGRDDFTYRWLWLADHLGLHYPIVIADGDPNSPLGPLLAERRLFPSLNYRYFRYHDDSYAAFYRKVADAARKVETPYVVLADNDDFPSIAGTERALSFLDAHRDYVTCGGHALAFTLDPEAPLAPLAGPPYNRWLLDSSHPVPAFEAEDPLMRLRALFGRDTVTYYNVSRTEALIKTADMCVTANFADLWLHELFFAGAFLGQGKVCLDGTCIGHFRQQKTSSQASRQRPLAIRLLQPTWSGDVANFVAGMSGLMGTGAGDVTYDGLARMVSRKAVYRGEVAAAAGPSGPGLSGRAVVAAKKLLPLREWRLEKELRRVGAEIAAKGGNSAAVVAEIKKFDQVLQEASLESYLRDFLDTAAGSVISGGSCMDGTKAPSAVACQTPVAH